MCKYLFKDGVASIMSLNAYNHLLTFIFYLSHSYH